ncbi:hypothetical protein JW872_02775 [Candidatus Babeliales bacterium]|nr:hypothetical protein [Candidatus Babeliales bacterium]
MKCSWLILIIAVAFAPTIYTMPEQSPIRDLLYDSPMSISIAPQITLQPDLSPQPRRGWMPEILCISTVAATLVGALRALNADQKQWDLHFGQAREYYHLAQDGIALIIGKTKTAKTNQSRLHKQASDLQKATESL